MQLTPQDTPNHYESEITVDDTGTKIVPAEWTKTYPQHYLDLMRQVYASSGKRFSFQHFISFVSLHIKPDTLLPVDINDDEAFAHIPEATTAQRKALVKVYNRLEGRPEFSEWCRTKAHSALGIDCIMVHHANMWLGIEPDGHIHS